MVDVVKYRHFTDEELQRALERARQMLKVKRAAAHSALVAFAAKGNEGNWPSLLADLEERVGQAWCDADEAEADVFDLEAAQRCAALKAG
jgi:uncharacterized membrane protein